MLSVALFFNLAQSFVTISSVFFSNTILLLIERLYEVCVKIEKNVKLISSPSIKISIIAFWCLDN